MHPIEELTINSLSDVLIWYVDEINTQGLWELLSVDKYSATNIVLGDTYSQLIYQITIKRRPLLDVINFILPVFCFLLLDVASYFIDASGAEKLSFKVTLLLTVSVFLQILNDTLPSTGDKIPLIGVYGIVIFILIGVSILETILVSFLMTRGAETSLAAPVETTAAITCQDDGVRDLQRPPETVRNENEEQSHTLNSLKTPLSWTRVARIIEVTFFVLYIITIIVFLSILGKVWYIE
ncbi:5-hydroxytryptamine receptor 3C-like [Myxocyprinus asiaticus]|uniref:5-hydroxytryptamine receptor 3C-like n=1 Tax=Myxocyprinus asiaticus TaxID=70543 RepID=UPI00222313D2|nr:5-hydroxytryptamine receptor 3C-like [Myxocyprinus asiaticus]